MSESWDSLDPQLLSEEETKRLIIQQMAGRRQNLAGSGRYLLPLAGQALQGAGEGLVASVLPNPATYNIPGAGLAVNTYRAIGSMIDLATRPLGEQFLEQPGAQIPGLDRANAAWNKQVADVRNATPSWLTVVGEPSTPGERIVREGMTEFGGMGPPINAGPRSITAFLAPNMLGRGIAGTNAAVSVAAPAVLEAVTSEGTDVSGNVQASQPDTNTTNLPIPPIPPTRNDTSTTQTGDVGSTSIIGSAPPLTEEPSSVTTGIATSAAVAIGIALLRGRAGWEAANAFAARESVAARRSRLYAAESADFNARRNTTTTETPAEINAPLPGNAGSFTTRVQNEVLNQDAVINAYLKHIDDGRMTPTGHNLTDDLIARLGMTNNRMSQSERIRQFAETGFHEPTGKRIPSFSRDIEARVAALSPDKQDLLDRAQYFMNELNNRANTQTRVGFANLDDAALWADVTRAKNDPEIAGILATIKNHNNGILDIMEAGGYFNRQEVAALRKRHESYLPAYNVETGRIDNPLASRNVLFDSGARGRDVPALELRRQHLEVMMEALERNTINRDIIKRAINYQTANPTHAKVFEYYNGPTNIRGSNSGAAIDLPADVIAFRDNGVPRYIRVHDPALRHSLQSNQYQIGHYLAAANNVYKSAVTGNLNTAVSLATGNPQGVFAPISAMRTAYSMGTNTVNGAYRGLLDKGVKALTGGKDIPFGDPTAFALTINQAIRGVAAEGANVISSIMAPGSPRWSGQQLRKLMPAQMADAIHMRMQMAWQASIRYEMKQLGLVHGSGYGSTATPDARFNVVNKVNYERYSLLNTMTPELTAAHNWIQRPSYVRTKSLLDEMMGAISESGNAAFYALNKNNPRMSKAKLGYETLQLAGHPGTAGRSNAIHRINASSAYFNVGLQGMARLGRQFNENPVKAAATHVSMLATLALGQWMYAMMKGPEAVNALVNEQNARQYSEGPKFDSTRLSLPQEVRHIWAILNASFSDALGFTTLRPGDTPPKETIDYLYRFFSHHITDAEGRAVLEGASQALPQIDVPPINALVAGITGRSPDLSLSSAINAIQTGNPDALTRPVGSSRQFPGMRTGSDSITGNEAGQRLEAIIENLTGVAGATMIDLYKIADSRVRRGDNPGDILDAMSMEATQAANDRSKFPTSLLFNSNRMERLVRDIPLVRNTQMTLNNMKQAGSFRSATQNEGYTSRQGFAVSAPTDAEAALPRDPAMQEIYMEAGQMYNRIQRGPIARINDLIKLDSSQVREGVVAGPRRLNHNQIERVIRDMYKDIALDLTTFNAEISQKYGVRFNVRDVDWKKDLSQFSPMQPN